MSNTGSTSNTKKLKDVAQVIRSKNAGPFRITFDIIFPDSANYQKVKSTGVINKELFAKLYRIPLDNITSFFQFDPGNAIKVTIRRPIDQGDVGETDMYGAQQHAPLLDIEIPWE
jgi:hypothetical protein